MSQPTKIYNLYSTTRDKYELAPSVWHVRAKNKAHAKKVLQEYLDENNINEKVMTKLLVHSKKSTHTEVICLQESIVE